MVVVTARRPSGKEVIGELVQPGESTDAQISHRESFRSGLLELLRAVLE
jgi:hypothetical protein